VSYIFLSQAFLSKHNFSCCDSKGILNKVVRFRESSFEFGEQIAVLGIVRDFTDERGEVHKVLYPVGNEVFTTEFCAAKGWSDWDRRSWKDLTSKPSVILTDMPDYFQVSVCIWHTTVCRHALLNLIYSLLITAFPFRV
jgi:hypothetical protein